jgi:hypothetical protein
VGWVGACCCGSCPHHSKDPTANAVQIHTCTASLLLQHHARRLRQPSGSCSQQAAGAATSSCWSTPHNLHHAANQAAVHCPVQVTACCWSCHPCWLLP